MLLERQVSCVVSEIVDKRRELDALLELDYHDAGELKRIAVLEKELHDLNRDVDRACRWLASCEVAV